MIANATIDDLLPVSEYRKKIFTKSRVESSWYKYNGQETCLVTRYIDDLDWYLIVEKDTAIIKESLLSQLWKDILVVACIIILILMLVSGTVSRYEDVYKRQPSRQPCRSTFLPSFRCRNRRCSPRCPSRPRSPASARRSNPR